jgi:serine phosphatase RsbU (regulator of sigma subunit)
MCALFESRAPQSAEPLPVSFPKIAGAEIAAAVYGNRGGGDFYDCFRASPERVLFGLLDVAGRRETNQPILDAAQKIFRTLGAELFQSADINESEAMVKLCLDLNRGVMEQASGVHPCPAFIGCYHERFGTLCYTNAGHIPGLIRDATGISELASTGLPLGLFSHATCDAPTIGLEKGAALLLVSRGVVEGNAKEKSGEDGEFGLERAKQFLQSDSSKTAQSLCDSFLNAVGELAGESTSTNDKTALAMVRTA